MTLSTFLTCAACLGLATASAFAAGDETDHRTLKDCRIAWDGLRLTITNSALRATWSVRPEGLLAGESLDDTRGGISWGPAPPALTPVPSPGFEPDAKRRRISCTITAGRAEPTEAESLSADVRSAGHDVTLIYRFRVFPGVAAVLQGLAIEDLRDLKDAGTRDAVLMRLRPATSRVALTAAKLLAGTDRHHDLLTSETRYSRPTGQDIRLNGNLFWLEDESSGRGAALLKHAPLPPERTSHCESDAVWNLDDGTVALRGLPLCTEWPESYECAVILYADGRAGRIAALQDYYRCLRQHVPGRDGVLLSNTWGDRNRDARICDAFVRQEIDRGAALGVDVVQLDDGWQAGMSANSAQGKGRWDGFWNGKQDFWAPNAKRFPDGLAPLVAAADAHGMQLGLWYALDSSDDFANWKRDADRVLRLHRELSVNHFKFDAINLAAPAAERHLRSLFRSILEESAGAITVDLDVTAGHRPGYFGAPRIGPIFVENRYTDWKTYWPHKTLRNLWCLAQYVDPVRLRMEFLNNTRNQEKYGNDPLAPATYDPATLFAAIMVSSPLAWMEVSQLPPEYASRVAELISVWKTHRERLQRGNIIPVGKTPDGKSWTGFVSVAPDRRSGYAVTFRETSATTSADFELPLLESPAELDATALFGNGSATVLNGRLHVELAAPRDFLFVRLEPRGSHPIN